MRLGGKVAMITGAAHGMGESEAILFAREGAIVVVADVMEADGRQVAAKISADGGKAQFLKLDVSSEPDWQEAVRTATGAYGRLDILVNNAGISGSHDPDTLSTAAWDSLKKSLKADYNESLWDHLAGTRSASFESGEQNQVAVKVIDDRGIELLVVMALA